MTVQIVLPRQHSTMEHAIAAVLNYVRSMEPHRDDEQLQYFLLCDRGEVVQVVSVDVGTWTDFGDGGLEAIAVLAHGLRADGAAFVEKRGRDPVIFVDVHLRGRPRGLSYRLHSDPRAPSLVAGFEICASEQPFDIVPGSQDEQDGRAAKIWTALDARSTPR